MRSPLLVLLTVCLHFHNISNAFGSSPASPFTLSFTSSNYNGFGVSCNGSADGTIDMTVTGGLAPFTILWSNGSSSEDISGLTAGTYIVTVTDADAHFAIDSVIITEPDILGLTLTPTSTTCNNSNGSISSLVTGGAGGNGYLWSGGETTADIVNQLPNTYTVTVTDINGCTISASETILALPPPQAVLDSISHVACFGNSTGAIYITVTDGALPLSFLWSSGASSEDLTGVLSGTYTVTVTDNDLCTSTISNIVVNEPAAALNDSVQVTNATCGNSNGAITVFPYDGTSPYTYLWNGGSTSPTITGLAPGSYTVTITDANLCTRQRTSSIINIPGPTAAIDSVRNVRCFGQATGGVFISVSGGTNPISYLWTGGSTSQDLTNVIAGTYTVTVTDGNSCTFSLSSPVSQPAAALNDSVQVTNATCGNSNGAITVFPYNGTSPYTYLWNGGSTSPTITGLTPGSYTVTITDANLCTRQRTSSIINIPGPTAAIDSVRNVRCFGQATGGVFISVSGGTNPISYLWTGGSTSQDLTNVIAGTYTVTVTDGNSCTFSLSSPVTQPAAALNDSVQVTNATCGNSNGAITVFPYNGTSPYTYLWNGGSTSPTITGLAPGSYTVTITDANLCTRQRTSSIINIPGPTAAIDSVRNVRCFGQATGGVFISVSGGTNPISYLWTGGSTSQDLTNVIAGTYTVTVTDGNSCTFSLSSPVSQPAAALNDSVQVTNATCGNSNGAITVFPYNGTSPYTYLWNGGSTSPTITGLAPGSYTVTITDANLCTRQRTSSIINIPGPTAAIDSVRNVRCFGQATGGVFISVSGGTNPISYLWTGGSTTQDLTNVIAGTYTVTVTDGNSCTFSLSSPVTQPAAALNDSVQVTNATCGNINGGISVFAYNGTSPYSYLWNGGSTSPIRTNLAPGTYTVTITDANLCTRQRTSTIVNIPGPIASLDSVRNVACFGQATGAIYISVSSGTPPFSYLWTGGSTSQDLVNAISGAYMVTVTDSNSCVTTLGTTITQPFSALNDSVQVTSATCGMNNGAITIFPYGGTSPYSFLWNSGSTAQTRTNLAPGTYTVTITDFNSCTRQRTVTVLSPPGASLALDSIQHVACFGQATGAIYISVTAGVGPFTYLWTGGTTAQDLVNVVSGSYTVTVTDANLCTSTLSGIINQPVAALNDSVQITHETCGNNVGSISVFPFGGTSPYSYLWNTGQTSSSISNLSSGSYTVTVTDFNLCTKQQTVIVDSISYPVTVLDSITHVNCFGDASGAIYITSVGGVAPISFLWSNGATTSDLINVTSGSYTLTVTDSSMCVSGANGVINQPAAALNDSVQVTHVTCNAANGEIEVFAFGGTPGYNYLWSNLQTTPTISGLTSGNYTVTVTDLNACSLQSVITVMNNPIPVANIDSIQNVSCFNGNNGAVYISVTGGNSPFTFLWSNGAVTQNISNLITGTYTVTVTDADSCTSTVNAFVSQPAAALNDSVQVVNATCGNSNGNVTVFPFNGTPPYTLLWSNSATTPTISGLAPGPYTVTITDSLGCTRQRSVTVNNIAGPTVTVSNIGNVNCFGDSTGFINISVSGGTSPFTYLWSSGDTVQNLLNVPAGIYTVSVTDNNGCTASVIDTVTQTPTPVSVGFTVNHTSCGLINGSVTATGSGGAGGYSYLWNTSSMSPTIFNLSSGVYTVTVTDALNCSTTDTVSVNSSSAPVATINSIINANCAGQSNGGIVISVSGGVNPYGFLWSNNSMSQNLSGVPAGIYTVTVTDFVGCTVSASGTVAEPDTLQTSLTVTDAACGVANGEITTTTTGGTLPYQYLWSNGWAGPVNSNLLPGIYTVTITDNHGCSVIASDTVFNLNGPTIILDSIIHVNCFGGNTGSIHISISGGASPIDILWSNGAISPVNSNLIAGNYTVTVTDDNGCSVQSSYTVTQQVQITDMATVVPASCGLNNGSITANPSGGFPPYQYLWNTNEITQTISNLASGPYTVTVTDSVGCSVIFNYNIISFSALTISTDSIVQVKCKGAATGAIYISVAGGASPYTYLWSNGFNFEDNLNLLAGSYTVVVTDSLLCSDSLSFVVNEPATALVIDSLNTNPANCNLNNGTAKVFASGGTPSSPLPYTYLWSNGGVSQTASGFTPGGPYTVTVTDGNGCSVISNFNISSIPIHTVTLNNIVNVNCFGDSTGAVFINVASGSPPYVYSWSNGANVQNIQNVPAGIYTITVTDGVNCSVTQSYTVQQSSLIIDNATVTNATCGFDNGVISVAPSGGIPTYLYQWSNGASTDTITGLAIGVYTVTITDDLGCSVIHDYTINDIPGPVISLNSIVNTTCFAGNDGSIDINISASTPSWTILWSNNEITEDISNLNPGIFTVTVTDDNGCTISETYTVGEATEITSGAVIEDEACNSGNGSIILNPAGGTGPYTFQWSTGSSNDTITGLSAATYTLTITDSLFCSSTFQLIVSNSGAPIITPDSTINIKCAGDSTGAIFISVNGGTQPYSFIWSNLEITEDLIGFTAGVYILTVTDSNGCIAAFTDTIFEPAPIDVVFNVVDANCNTPNGSIEAIISGGVGGYILEWSNGETVPVIDSLNAGVYTLTVTDGNGCIKIFTSSVSNISAPAISVIDSSNVSCFGANNGEIIVSVSGGQQPYIYSWSNTSQTGDTLTNLPGNVLYTLTITDNLGCVAIRSVFISQPAALNISAVVPQLNDTFNLTCFGTNDGSITLQVSGGVSPYSYLWSNLAVTPSLLNLAAANYTVTVTDLNGCTLVRTFRITQPPLLVSIAGSNNVICGNNYDTLNATPPTIGIGYWTLVSGTGIFADSLQPNTLVTGLSNGVNVFQWVVTDGICFAVSQVVINYNTNITAIAGENREVCKDSVLLTATTPQFGSGYWQVINSSGVIADSSKAVTQVTGLQLGPNLFQWIVVNGTCRDTAKLTIFLNDSIDCIEPIEMPTGFTPNGDGKNDYFVIHGIEEFPDNSLVIFNRWGNIVYEKSSYRNDWDGSNTKGDPLPEGTYFVVFKIRTINLVRNSYIDLRR